MNQTTASLTPIEQFRSNPDFVGRMRQIIDDEVMQRALIALKDGNPPTDAPLTASEVTSVRVLSQSAGFHQAIATFLSLAEPLIQLKPEEPPTWGTDTQPEGAD